MSSWGIWPIALPSLRRTTKECLLLYQCCRDRCKKGLERELKDAAARQPLWHGQPERSLWAQAPFSQRRPLFAVFQSLKARELYIRMGNMVFLLFLKMWKCYEAMFVWCCVNDKGEMKEFTQAICRISQSYLKVLLSSLWEDRTIIGWFCKNHLSGFEEVKL